MTSPDRARVQAWLRQAEADLSAARVSTPGICECHQRYWLQQSYEKAIKAYALMVWSWQDPARTPAEQNQDQQQPGEREKKTRRKFFEEHSPIYAMQRDEYHGSKSLRVLTMRIKGFVQNLGNPHSDNILRIDATAPTPDPQQVSYRYPFEDHGQYIAPANYATQDWSSYQGDNIPNLSRSVERLYQRIYEVFQRYRG